MTDPAGAGDRGATGAMAAVESLGGRCLGLVERLGLATLFLLQSLVRYPLPPVQFGTTVAQLHFIGARSMLVILASGAFTGMVVALQFHDTLVRFGSVSLLGSAVGLSLVRELGPVLTALMVTGRAGSALCAEIAIMRTEEQIDALECMSVDPLRFLVGPRLVAGLLAVPLLTAVFVVVGIGGGWFVAVVLFGVGHGAYFQGLHDGVLHRDLLMGLVKSVVFGLIIFWTATAKGYFIHLDPEGNQGSQGVSQRTTSAVVVAAIAVLFTDYLVSALLL